jgi:hypothetical protein
MASKLAEIEVLFAKSCNPVKTGLEELFTPIVDRLELLLSMTPERKLFTKSIIEEALYGYDMMKSGNNVK